MLLPVLGARWLRAMSDSLQMQVALVTASDEVAASVLDAGPLEVFL